MAAGAPRAGGAAVCDADAVSVHDVAGFLGRFAPFDALEPEALEAVGRAVEIEFHPSGDVVFAQGAAPAAHVWVVRSGAVELVDRERVLDELGPGEMFGHPSMLSGLPTGFEARAREDTLCYRLPADVVAPVLAMPAGMSFVARSLLARAEAPAGILGEDLAADPAHRRVDSFLRTAPVLCAPDTPIRDAARRMTDAGLSSVIVELGGGRLGIVTDRDLRTHVATGGVPVDAPVSSVMTPDAFTVAPDRLGIEAVIDMLDRGVRHAPVVDGRGRVLGVLDDVDLLAAEGRTPFHLRRTIADAPSRTELEAAGRELPAMLVALFDAGVAPGRISAVQTIVIDALTRRLLDLAIAELGPAPVPFSWLALGSLGRREAVPSSDADTGLVWDGDDADPQIRHWMGELAARVVDGLGRCGLAPDDHGVRADRPLFARSADAWRTELKAWIDDPAQEKALIAVSVLFDGRVVAGEGLGRPVATWLAPEARRRALLRLLARLALAHRPPTGFLRDIVVEHSGEHRGALDIKRGGVLPIADLARWAGITAGATDPGTAARIARGAQAGILTADDARTLSEAWDLVTGLRLEHQVGRLRAGRPPDDHLRPDELNPLTRRYLREAFRAVAAVQKHVSNELSFGTGA